MNLYWEGEGVNGPVDNVTLRPEFSWAVVVDTFSPSTLVAEAEDQKVREVEGMGQAERQKGRSLG